MKMGWMADGEDQSDSTAKSKRTDVCVCGVVWCSVGDGGRAQICDQWNSKSRFDKKRKDENER